MAEQGPAPIVPWDNRVGPPLVDADRNAPAPIVDADKQIGPAMFDANKDAPSPVHWDKPITESFMTPDSASPGAPNRDAAASVGMSAAVNEYAGPAADTGPAFDQQAESSSPAVEMYGSPSSSPGLLADKGIEPGMG